MRCFPFKKLFISVFTLIALVNQPVYSHDGQLRYPDNLAWRLITETEIQQITNCPERPGKEQNHAAPLFKQPHTPLGGVQVAPNNAIHAEEAPKTWEVAPFPYIAPPSDDSGWILATPTRKKDQHLPSSPSNTSKKRSESPTVFAELETHNSPSAALRPKRRNLSQDLLLPTERLPEPFSLRRYHTDKHGYVQIAVYGGFSSIDAEIAYKTLRSASPNRQAISGLGKEAFISLVTLGPNEEKERDRDQRLTPDSFAQPEQAQGFAAITPEGERHLEQSDAVLIKSSQAPFFNDIPIAADSLTAILPNSLAAALRFNLHDTNTSASSGGSNEPADSTIAETNFTSQPTNDTETQQQDPPLPTAAPAPMSMDGTNDQLPTDGHHYDPSSDFVGAASSEDETNSEQVADPFSLKPNISENGDYQVLVLIMHFPDKDAVVELALDTRLGTLQNLISMAFLIQNRLLNRW